jgi:hypothetical protein
LDLVASYITEGSKTVVSLKISLSGTNLMVVPLFLDAFPMQTSFDKGIPFEYS